ncbi:MAG TPA: tetratricopeptide repeat protein [Casimicrobiaceae bacterium]|nr:tetratricopeptide repeat protein [Casimicrobiaceae bacterium]
MVSPAPADVEQAFARAAELHRSGKLAEAGELYAAILHRSPDHFATLHWLGVVRAQLGAPAQALELIDRALRIDAGSAQLHADRGNVLRMLDRPRDALEAYDHALRLQPAFAEALNNRGTAAQALGRVDDALADYNAALALQPLNGAARLNRALALTVLRRHEQAREDFQWALHLRPDLEAARGGLFHANMQCGEWRDYKAQVERLRQDVRAGRHSIEPFEFLGVSDVAREQLQCAQAYVEQKHPAITDGPAVRVAHSADRIRVAYLSADLCAHAVANLLAGVWESHDHARFETIALSLGPDTGDSMRLRVQSAFDRFLDVQCDSDADIAQRIAELGVDILVDLGAYTGGGRPGILARRAAPIQLSFLGYPGTTGAPYVDYLIADRYVVPEQHEAAYSERVACLPDTFQANDAKRQQPTPITRAQAGIPDDAFVYCCFNNDHKITPTMFDVWMRLLRRHEHAVLWLLGGNPSFVLNARREAVARGIDAGRLIFAQRASYATHLSRCTVADLFLDTLPFNAGATASDALWAGLPVLTCSGEAFAARMAGSVLRAIGLPQLVTESLADYEALADRLAGDPPALAQIKERLLANRATHPLFDTQRFTRHLESAYTTMWERHRRGDAPQGFAVSRGD